MNFFVIMARIAKVERVMSNAEPADWKWLCEPLRVRLRLEVIPAGLVS